MQKEDLTNPSYYNLGGGVQSIDLLEKMLTSEQFRGYCKGNAFKYNLRSGKKKHITDEMIYDLSNAFPDKDNYSAVEVAKTLHKWQEELNIKMALTDMGKKKWYEDKLDEFNGKRDKIFLNWVAVYILILLAFYLLTFTFFKLGIIAWPGLVMLSVKFTEFWSI